MEGIGRMVRGMFGARAVTAMVAAVDRFCRRTNDGLLAVALALALVVGAILVCRNVDLIEPTCDAETGICVDVPQIDTP